MKLHIGCGPTGLPGYKRVDIRSEVSPDICCDARSLEDSETQIIDGKVYEVFHRVVGGSVDEIYSSHLIEHFSFSEVPEVLKEWHRVLKPGLGLLRISLPDISVLCRLYLVGAVHLERIRGPMYGGQTFPENFHYSCWDYETMACLLRKVGFYDIRTWDPFEMHPPEYDDFSKAKINGCLISLNVEATKCRSLV